MDLEDPGRVSQGEAIQDNVVRGALAGDALAEPRKSRRDGFEGVSDAVPADDIGKKQGDIPDIGADIEDRVAIADQPQQCPFFRVGAAQRAQDAPVKARVPTKKRVDRPFS